MSGMTMSTPRSSCSGNISPASMTMMSSPERRASMFIPNSPNPPSGMAHNEGALNLFLSSFLPGGYGNNFCGSQTILSHSGRLRRRAWERNPLRAKGREYAMERYYRKRAMPRGRDLAPSAREQSGNGHEQYGADSGRREAAYKSEGGDSEARKNPTADHGANQP